MSAQWYDANISLPGCDKNMPGTVIAMARLNRPAIMVYGGTIKPGFSALDGGKLDVVSAFQSFGALAEQLPSPRWRCCVSLFSSRSGCSSQPAVCCYCR